MPADGRAFHDVRNICRCREASTSGPEDIAAVAEKPGSEGMNVQYAHGFARVRPA